jgi:hypothetical protein
MEYRSGSYACYCDVMHEMDYKSDSCIPKTCNDPNSHMTAKGDCSCNLGFLHNQDDDACVDEALVAERLQEQRNQLKARQEAAQNAEEERQQGLKNLKYAECQKLEALIQKRKPRLEITDIFYSDYLDSCMYVGVDAWVSGTTIKKLFNEKYDENYFGLIECEDFDPEKYDEYVLSLDEDDRASAKISGIVNAKHIGKCRDFNDRISKYKN